MVASSVKRMTVAAASGLVRSGGALLVTDLRDIPHGWVGGVVLVDTFGRYRFYYTNGRDVDYLCRVDG